MKLEIGAKLEEEPLEIQGDKGSKKIVKKSKTSCKVIPKEQHRLVFRFERRAGKPVTIIGRFFLKDEEKMEILKYLKKKLACGGKCDGEWLELQGDIKDRVIEILKDKNWRFKK